MDNFKAWTGLSVEQSIRMTEDRDKWRKYVHGVANPRIEDRQRTEQNVGLDKWKVMFDEMRRYVMLSYHVALATALLQHGISFVPPSKSVHSYIVSSAT